MMKVNLNNPLEIRTVGMKALREALGPVGAVQFMQQYDLRYGDYTKEKLAEQGMSLNDLDKLLTEQRG